MNYVAICSGTLGALDAFPVAVAAGFIPHLHERWRVKDRLKMYARSAAVLSVPALGLAAVLYSPRPAAAQDGAVTCWAESCEGNVCVRVKIQCPKVIQPVM